MRRPFFSSLSTPLLLGPLFLAGCGASESGSRASLTAPEDEAGSTRASREEHTLPVEATTTGPAVAPPRAIIAPLTLSRIEGAIDAEDGEGHVLSSERAVAIDLDASMFPPRALDPVLTIGALRLSHYRHPRIGVLRFIVASPELLVDGSVLSVQYGDETPTIVSPSITVPAEVRQ